MLQAELEESGAAAAADASPAARRLRAALQGVLCNRAQALLRLGRPGEAERAASSALELDPRSPKALYRRGAARRAQGRLAAAAADFDAAVRLDPSNAEAAKARADALAAAAAEQAAAAAAAGGNGGGGGGGGAAADAAAAVASLLLSPGQGKGAAAAAAGGKHAQPWVRVPVSSSPPAGGRGALVQELGGGSGGAAPTDEEEEEDKEEDDGSSGASSRGPRAPSGRPPAAGTLSPQGPSYIQATKVLGQDEWSSSSAPPRGLPRVIAR